MITLHLKTNGSRSSFPLGWKYNGSKLEPKTSSFFFSFFLSAREDKLFFRKNRQETSSTVYRRARRSSVQTNTWRLRPSPEISKHQEQGNKHKEWQNPARDPFWHHINNMHAPSPEDSQRTSTQLENKIPSSNTNSLLRITVRNTHPVKWYISCLVADENNSIIVIFGHREMRWYCTLFLYES